MKKKKRITIILLCALCLSLASCDKSTSKNKVEATNDTTVEKLKLTKWEKYSLPENIMLRNIKKVSATGDYYVLGFNENYMSSVYLYKNGTNDNEQISLAFEDEDYYIYNFCPDVDGKFVYFSGIPLSKCNAEGDIKELKIYRATIKKDKITNVTLLQGVNNEKFQILGDVASDGTLLYEAFSQADTSDLSIVQASPDGETYKLEKLTASDSSKVHVVSYAQSGILNGNHCKIMSTTTEEGIIDSMFLGDFSNHSLKKEKDLILPEEIQDKITGYSLSTDGTEIFFICVDKETKKTEVYVTDLETFVNNAANVATYEKCSYDTYDTSNFPMKFRAKKNEEKKQGVYYEIFVRSFCDSDGDGIGDFNGITEKLDYLKNLGVDGIWLMPINSSPSYHGYDVTDYYSLNKDYGTEEDFQHLLTEAHNRNMKVIMDFVINHTSDSHPWFTDAISSEKSKYRNYYRWVKKYDTVDFSASDISDMGTKVWHKSGEDYYYGIFDSSMPDLNYNNKEVRKEIKNAAKHWLKLGVDGFRLDAAIHIYGDYEFKQMKDTTEANLQWWNEFALACEEVNPDVYLVGEAWKEDDTLATYTQPFDTKFNFTFEQDMIEAVKKETSVAISSGKDLAQNLSDILNTYMQESKGNYIDGMFGSNHDQDRIISQVGNIQKAKLIANIYLTLPGNPFIYYGEEIGMLGEGDDKNKREPFKWSKNGTDGDTSWDTAEYNKNTRSLSEQMTQKNSMYRHYKDLIAFRKKHSALSNGEYKPYDAKNKTILAYERNSEKEHILMIHNLSGKDNKITIPENATNKILYGNGTIKNNQLVLKAYESVALEIK